MNIRVSNPKSRSCPIENFSQINLLPAIVLKALAYIVCSHIWNNIKLTSHLIA